MKCALSAGILLSLAAGNAIAESDNPSGFYAGAGVGRFDVDIHNVRELGTAVKGLKANDTAWRAFVGYRVTPYISIDAAYIDFGSASDNFDASGTNGNYRLKLSGFSPSIIGTVPAGPVELFAKAGWYFYDTKVRVNLNGGDPISSSSNSNDFMYGGGVGITLFQRLSTKLEYEVIDLKNTHNANALWASAAWRF